jgi:hypothetical protein
MMISGTKRDAIESLLIEGKNPTDISRITGIPRTTVRYWIEKLSVEDLQGKYNIKPTDNVSTNPIGLREAADFIKSLAPIKIDAPKRNNIHILDSHLAVVIGDTHFGVECQKTLDVFYQIIDELKPSKIILNGDTVDLMAVSRYPKDVRYEVSLLQERVAYHKFLTTIYDICGLDVEIYETNANHSGDGVEGRWWRYLSERLGSLATLPDVIDNLSYDKIFLPEWANVKMVDFVELCNSNLYVMHGDVVRKHGGFSARGMLDKWFTSIIMNHTHRAGLTSQRIPGLGGRREQTITVYENACACDLRPCYSSAPNWQNGLSIVAMNGDSFGVEQVLINNGIATSTTLGKTIRA